MNKCEYCNKPVKFPLPIHPDCARIWLRGWYASSGENKNKNKFAFVFMGVVLLVLIIKGVIQWIIQ